MFPELLAFSRSGEAREALTRAYTDAGPVYAYRFVMLAPLALTVAIFFASLSAVFVTKRGDPVLPDTLM